MSVRLSFVLALGLFGGRALSFPEYTNHGYPSCATCHVSPSGGGALTPYGRGASEALVSTWSYEGEAQPGMGLLGTMPPWLMLGGDQRGVGFTSRQPDKVYTRPTYIPMEASAEVAAYSPWLPGLTVDVSGGVYGPEHTPEYRRYYLKAMLSPNVGLRIGRFMPAYGIAVQDHTTTTRDAMSLGEGEESYNAEAFWLAPGGELIVTAVLGQAATTELDDKHRVGTLRTDDLVGATARAAVYAGSMASLGVSGMSLKSFEGAKRNAGGLFAQTGINDKVYILAEADRLWESGNKPVNMSLLKLGMQAVQGLIGYIQGESLDLHTGGRLGLQWQPRPHWELLAEYRVADAETFGALPRNSCVGLLHHWL